MLSGTYHTLHGTPPSTRPPTHSYGELHNDVRESERLNRLNPGEEKVKSFVTESFENGPQLTVACSDYQRALPDAIRSGVPGDFEVLGTDGFGRSDTRDNLRRFFEIDRQSIVAATLSRMAERGEIDASVAKEAIAKYELVTGPRSDITLI